MKQSRFIDFDAISGKYKPDCQTYVSGADIRHNEMITRATHGLPVGNGIMGSLIWNQDDHTLHAQINRVDVFGYNSAGTGVHAHEDYGYGCGQIHIDFGGNPFAGAVSHIDARSLPG